VLFSFTHGMVSCVMFTGTSVPITKEAIMNRQQVLQAIKVTLTSLNDGDVDYSPATVADLVGLPVVEVAGLIVKAGWCQMGHEHSVLGFYELR